MQETARVQKEIAEILCAVAAHNRTEAVIQRPKLAEDAIRALTLSTSNSRGQLDRLESLRQRHESGGQPGSPAEPLTAREETVLRLLRGTLSYREIGQALYVSHNTVKSHTRAIYRKLGVSSRDSAIKRGCELGLLLQEDSGTAAATCSSTAVVGASADASDGSSCPTA
jgi:ATP/maltotriose-dependent transcriptional regulator MalT